MKSLILLSIAAIVAVAYALTAHAQVPLIGDVGVTSNSPVGCPTWPPNPGYQFPEIVWQNPQPVTIYITGFSVILELSNNVAAADMWGDVYRRSDKSRLYNALHEFVKGQSYRAEDVRQFAPNFFTLAPGDALLLDGGCVAYDTQRAKDAGLVLNVWYATQQPGATPTAQAAVGTPIPGGSTVPLVIPAR